MCPRCIILTPLYSGEASTLLRPQKGDLLICADGGYRAARRFQLQPDLMVADFDSMPDADIDVPELIRLPTHKDETDLEICLREGHARGYRSFLVGGGIGGRFSHTLAALQLTLAAAKQGDRVWLLGQGNAAAVLTPGAYRLHPPKNGYLSLLALTDQVRGVRLTGTEWTLDGAVLTNHAPLGTSNRALKDSVRLCLTDGALALIYDHDDGAGGEALTNADLAIESEK